MGQHAIHHVLAHNEGGARCGSRVVYPFVDSAQQFLVQLAVDFRISIATRSITLQRTNTT